MSKPATSLVIAVLAAGRGRRLGADVPKPLVEVRGRTLIELAVEAATTAKLGPVLVVVGYGATSVGAAVPAGTEVVTNQDWSEGIASSVRAAVSTVRPRTGVGAIIVGLGDQPRIGPEAYRRLASAYAGGSALAVATYRGRRANPVLIARSLWDEVDELRGDEGARQLFTRFDVVEVACDGTGDPTDIDTAADLAAMEA